MRIYIGIIDRKLFSTIEMFGTFATTSIGSCIPSPGLQTSHHRPSINLLPITGISAPCFAQYLATLGVITYNGREKQAYTDLGQDAHIRGWWATRGDPAYLCIARYDRLAIGGRASGVPNAPPIS